MVDRTSWGPPGFRLSWCLGRASQEPDQVSHLLTREAGILHAHPPGLLGHAGGVLPDCAGPSDGRPVAWIVLRQLLGYLAAFTAIAMALEASLPDEEGVPPEQVGSRIPRCVRLQIRHQIGHLGGLDLR